MKVKSIPVYSIGEEIANAVIHGVGALGATAGLVLLALKNGGILGGQRAGSLDIAVAIIFSSTMIGMFLMSTLYHAIQRQGVKKVFYKLDHSFIYVLIAGTYTPVCLSGIGGAWGWALFGTQWALALLGIIFNCIDFKMLRKLELILYILMGWMIVIGFIPLIRSVAMATIVFIFIGGLIYTLGTVFYRKKHIRFTHAIWHAFVIIGALCHWFAVWHLH